jgi:hypothetical protein
VRGRDSVLHAVLHGADVLEQRLAISHITQCEMPFRRSAIAVAAATAPTPTWPRIHSHSAMPPTVLAISSTMTAPG